MILNRPKKLSRYRSMIVYTIFQNIESVNVGD